jgi:hypothetical protein
VDSNEFLVRVTGVRSLFGGVGRVAAQAALQLGRRRDRRIVELGVVVVSLFVLLLVLQDVLVQGHSRRLFHGYRRQLARVHRLQNKHAVSNFIKSGFKLISEA